MAFVLRSVVRLVRPPRPVCTYSVFHCLRSPVVTRRWPLVNARSLHSSRILASNPGVSIAADGKKFKVAWPEGKENTFHAIWLRHNCQCPECWDTDSDQQLVGVEQLQGGVALKDASITDSPDGQRMTISWTYQEGGGEHTGFIDLSFLKENSYSSDLVKQRTIDCRPRVAKTLPTISYTDITRSEEKLWEWLQLINEFGVCVVTDIPTTLGENKKLAKLAGGILKTYYGVTFDVISQPVPVNLAYSETALPYHMDLCHYESPPGLQFLHCIKNDECVEGGHNVLVDSFPVLEELRQKHPQHFKTLTKVPATFQRIHFKRDNPASMTLRKPHIILDSSGNITGFRWHPQSMGPLLASQEDVEKYYEAYCCLGHMLANNEWKFYHLLKPGDALTFNNRRMLHSRTEYKSNGGERHLQGVYVNIDAFKSKVRVLATKYAPGYTVKAVLNQDAL